jgi:hypothetical protein
MIINHYKKSELKIYKKSRYFLWIIILFLLPSLFYLLPTLYSDSFSFGSKINGHLSRPDKIVLRTAIKSIGISDSNPRTLLSNLFNNFPSYILPNNNLPELRIDIKFKEYEKLRKDREEALNSKYYDKWALPDDPYKNTPFGLIVTDKLSWAKADVTFNNKKVKAKVRLKGDMLDHIATSKWSLRMNIKDGAVAGMRKINHQNPLVRDFHTEALIHDAMTFRGVIAPRTIFTNTFINGEKIGPMYIEEHLSEPMTEFASRPYGPMLAYDFFKTEGLKIYDEEMFWNNDLNLKAAISNLDYYLGKKAGVTQNFRNNPELALETFDSETWARYLAVTFIYKCFHGNGDSNLKFYFHPLKKKVEPISFDNGCGQKEPSRHLGFLPIPGEFIYELLKIQSFRKLLKIELDWWSNSIDAENFIEGINNKEQQLRKELSWDSPFLEKYSISADHIPDIILWLNEFDDNRINEIDINDPNQLLHLTFSIMKDNNSLKLVVLNPEIKPLSDLKMLFETKESTQYIPLKNYIFDEETSAFIYDIDPIIFSNDLISSIDKVKLEYSNTKTDEIIFTSDIYLTYKNKRIPIYPESTIEYLKKYFRVDLDENLIILDEFKNIQVLKDLIIPDDYELVIKKGAVLNFASDASLIIKGKTNILGTKKENVIFQGIDGGSWPGVLILANSKDIKMNGFLMQEATGKSIGGYNYTGAMTIFEGKINISDATFSKNVSEDSLNLVNTNGVIRELHISNTTSDGLDIDFGRVTLRDSTFSDIGTRTGADAIDISHASVEIYNIRINRTTDKGLSIGESANVKVQEMFIEDALVGIAAKDSSFLEAKNLKFSEISLANIMAYNKKPHHDGANVYIEDIQASESIYINQKGSKMTIDNQIIIPKKIDVASMYDSYMKSIK